MNSIRLSILMGLFLVASCKQDIAKKQAVVAPQKTERSIPAPVAATPAGVLSRKEVPILCYHNIKNIAASAGPNTKVYTVSPIAFEEQMKALSDHGFHSVLPGQLREYLLYGRPLPANPVLITFDDTHEEQYRIGAAEMEKYGFKGVFFVMTVSINRPHYMSKAQIKSLSDTGHVIGAHTWDHHRVTQYSGTDWELQLEKPKKKLEAITGKSVDYFAYPFGLWNPQAIGEIKKRDYQLAFSLATKRDSLSPLYTIRRIIVSGGWSSDRLLKEMHSSFQ